MEALLQYAEVNGRCMYLMYADDNGVFSGWEDMLWDPGQLRQALLDFPDQTRAGEAYPGYNYPAIDVLSHTVWRIVDPKVLLAEFMEQAHDMQEHAEYFQRVWVDRSELPLWKQDDDHDE
jgi:hypothetical protein